VCTCRKNGWEASLYNSQWFLLFYNNNERFTYLAASVHTAQYQDLQRPLDPLPPPAKIFSTHWRLAVAANLIATFCSSLTPRSLKKLSVVSKHYASPYIIKWCWCASLKDRPLQTRTIIFLRVMICFEVNDKGSAVHVNFQPSSLPNITPSSAA
jgi:hypothetical protein